MPTEPGLAIKKLRLALGGLSQARFARRLGTTLRTVARWESLHKLSPATLSRLRNVAFSASHLELVAYFEDQLRKDLHWLPANQFEDERFFPVPATPQEMKLVGEFLRRYRAHDPTVQPWVDQLCSWIVENQAESNP